ncbi:hypothetical protein LADH09A_001516, partial [Micromonospora sp. LAH09]|nr:hypothetical protein [Micromonospora cabrerizensis]
LTAAATGRTEPTAEGPAGPGDRPEAQDPDDQATTISLPAPERATNPDDPSPAASAAAAPVANPTARRRTVRRAALIAVALLVAAAAGVGTALAVTGDEPNDTAGWPTARPPNRPQDGGGGPGGPGPDRPGPPPGGRNVPPPPFACVRPEAAGAPVPAGTPVAGERFRPPPGWVWHADTIGFRVAVPATWHYSREGTVACFQDPTTGRAFSVAGGDDTDPLARLRAVRDAAARAGALPGYDEIRLAAADGGAEWECRWQAPYGPWLHARQQVVGADRWTLGWITDDRDWNRAGADWTTVRNSFRPTP